MPRPSQPGTALAASIKVLCEDLEAARKKKGLIKLPSDTINAVTEALRSCRTNQKTVGKSYVIDIDRQLEDAENKVCGRLNAPAFNIILAIVILADHCREGERIMYMLGAAIHHEERNLGRSQAMEAKKVSIGKNSLFLLLAYFTDFKGNTGVRRWAGILCIQLLRGCKYNLNALECGSEEHRRQLGVVILEEPNEIIKTICAQIIRVAVEMGIEREAFWPNETEEKYYEGFPSASQNNTSWNQLYQSYMDFVWKLLNEPDQIGHIFFAQSVFTVPNSKFQILDHNVSGFVAHENITMLATCMPGSFDQCLEIPLGLITKVTVETKQGATKGKLWDLILDLRDTDKMFCHLDSVGFILQKICMVLNKENVAGVVNELENICPDLEVSIGSYFGVQVEGNGVELEKGVAPEPPSSASNAVTLAMGIDATTEPSPQASQNSTSHRKVAETQFNYGPEVINEDKQDEVSEGQDVEDKPTRNHQSAASTQSQTRPKVVTDEEELDELAEDEAMEDGLIENPQTTSNTKPQERSKAPTGGSQTAKSRTQNVIEDSLVSEEHSQRGKRKSQQSNHPTGKLATSTEPGANVVANTSQKRHSQGTQGSRKLSIHVKGSQPQQQTGFDQGDYSDSITSPEERDASIPRILPKMSLNKTSKKPAVISTTTSRSFAKPTAYPQARKAKPLKAKAAIYGKKNKNLTKEKPAENMNESNNVWDIPAADPMEEESSNRADLAPKALRKQALKTTKSATQVPKKSSAPAALDRPTKGKRKIQRIGNDRQAKSTKTAGPPKSKYKEDSHSDEVYYENEDEVFNLQQKDAKELGLVHDNLFSQRSSAAEMDLYNATPLKSKAKPKSDLDAIPKAHPSVSANDVASKLNEMLGDLDDELEKASPQVLDIKGKSEQRTLSKELQAPALAAVDKPVETQNRDDEAMAEVNPKQISKSHRKQSPSAAKETGPSISPETKHIEIKSQFPSKKVQKNTIKKVSVATRRRSQSIVPVKDSEYAESSDADFDGKAAQTDDGIKRKAKSNMPPSMKRRKTAAAIEPVAKEHSPSPAAKTKKRAVQKAKDKSPASRKSPRLTGKVKEGSEVLEATAAEHPLVDDYVSRKANLISFGAKGPRNQGPSSAARSSVARHSISSEPAESPFAGPEEISDRKRKLGDVTMDVGDSSKESSRKKHHSSPKETSLADLDDNPQIFNSSPPTQYGPKLNSQGSRVDYNGSPQAPGSSQVDHIGKLRNKLLVTEDNSDGATANEDVKELFGLSVVLSSGSRTRLESVERSRYVPHKKMLNGHYEVVNSNEVVSPGVALADPFSAKPGKEVSKFTKRLQTGRLSDTAVSNASMDDGSRVKNSQLQKYGSSRSPLLLKKILLEKKASPLSQTVAPTGSMRNPEETMDVEKVRIKPSRTPNIAVSTNSMVAEKIPAGKETVVLSNASAHAVSKASQKKATEAIEQVKPVKAGRTLHIARGHVLTDMANVEREKETAHLLNTAARTVSDEALENLIVQKVQRVTVDRSSNITVPKASADVEKAVVQKEKYIIGGRPSNVSPLNASTVDLETTVVEKPHYSKGNCSSKFVSTKISTNVEKPVVEKQHSKTARFAYTVPDISTDLEKTLVEQDSPSPNLTNSTSFEPDTSRSALGEFLASNSSWNMAIRSHYGNYSEALGHVAQEMIIRLSDKEDAVRLMAKQYQENGSKLLNQHLEKRGEEKASIVQGLERKKGNLVQVFTDAKNVADETLEDLKTTSVTDYKKQWESHQDSIKKQILAGKKACM